MSPTGLFAVGLLVTLIVGMAMALIVYGLILEGRDSAERTADEEHEQPSPSAIHDQGPRRVGEPRLDRLPIGPW